MLVYLQCVCVFSPRVRVSGDTKHGMTCFVLPYDYMETAFRYGCDIDFTRHTVTWKSENILTCRQELKAFHVLTSGTDIYFVCMSKSQISISLQLIRK
jgi:hypothetical protein